MWTEKCRKLHPWHQCRSIYRWKIFSILRICRRHCHRPPATFTWCKNRIRRLRSTHRQLYHRVSSNQLPLRSEDLATCPIDRPSVCQSVPMTICPTKNSINIVRTHNPNIGQASHRPKPPCDSSRRIMHFESEHCWVSSLTSLIQNGGSFRLIPSHFTGSFEESLLQRRLEPKFLVPGYKVLLAASGCYCTNQITIPAYTFFYELNAETLSTPYVVSVALVNHL